MINWLDKFINTWKQFLFSPKKSMTTLLSAATNCLSIDLLFNDIFSLVILEFAVGLNSLILYYPDFVLENLSNVLNLMKLGSIKNRIEIPFMQFLSVFSLVAVKWKYILKILGKNWSCKPGNFLHYHIYNTIIKTRWK